MVTLKRCIISAFVLIFVATPIMSAPAFAADPPYKKASLDKTIKVYLRGIWLQSCMKDRGKSNPGTDALDSYKWFDNNDGTAVGRYIEPNDDGRTDCSQPESVKNALSELGFNTSDPAGIQNTLGIKRGDSTDFNAIKDKVFAPFFGGDQTDGTGLLTNKAAYYLLNLTTFKVACGPPKFVVEKSAANATQNQQVTDGLAIVINEYDSTGKKIENIYTYTSEQEIIRNEDPSRFKRDGKTCKQIASYINDPSNGIAYAQYRRTHASEPLPEVGKDVTGASGDTDKTGEQKSSCNVDGIGWIVCPVLNFMAKITDQAYYVVSSMLQVRAFTTDDKDTKGALFSAWSAFRNIANVSFVFAFLVIIYSQLTSVGISNYGLKKLLPKLIIAAVLVNLSYWICMIAVDLSNFAGWALKSFFAGDGLFKITQPSSDTSSTGGAVGMASLTGSLLILGGVALYVGLTALLPVLITSLIAIVTVFLVLMMRQALIILLIVISPLAFVAYLLPNTESWFSKWRKLFTTLLLMYPIIGVIFGASALASKIVMASAPTGSGDETGIKIAIQIMGAGISMVPLFLTPIIMKTSGAVLGKFGGMINNPNKGPIDRMRKGANRLRENQEGKRSIRALNGGFVLPGTRGKYQRHAKKEAIAAGIKREQQYTQQQYVASQIAGGNTRFTNQVAGGSMGRFSPDASTEAIARALSSAEFTINEAEAKEVSAAQIRFENQGITSNTAFAELNSPNISNYSETERKALRQMVVQAGNADHIASLWNSLQSGNQAENLSERTSFAQQVEKNKPVGIGMGAIAQMKSAAGTSQTFEQALADGIVAGRFDASGAARADNSELDMVASVAQNATLMADAVNRYNTSNPTRTTTGADVVTKLKDDARTARTDSRYNAGKARSSLQSIENIP